MMAEDGVSGWTDAQWDGIRRVVHDEAMRARVAASFLPLYGPLGDDVQTVPKNFLGLSDIEGGLGAQMAVDDHNSLRLITISVKVVLKSAQLADPELGSAMIMFRRAADIIARVEDAIIFRGQANVTSNDKLGVKDVPPVFSISGGGDSKGLFEYMPKEMATFSISDDKTAGGALLTAIVTAIGTLESTGHLGPFACVLGTDLFTTSVRPTPGSLVMPRDSILPFLNGPLLRSSTLEPKQGVIISLQGEPVEIVVPKDISVRFLQTTLDNLHVFRVSQRFVLRIKEPSAVAFIAAA
jgi:uncharacterized linocin/CFP29 family protein